VQSQPTPKPSYEELEDEVMRMREILTAYHFAQSFYRFHAFDGIRDDACPACGGRVVIEESDVVEIRDGQRMPPGKRLKAVPW
jgi:hypothetical protein